MIAGRGIGNGVIEGAIAGSAVVGIGLPTNSPEWQEVEQPQLEPPHSEQPWWPQ
jgi:hypothetical protein